MHVIVPKPSQVSISVQLFGLCASKLFVPIHIKTEQAEKPSFSQSQSTTESQTKENDPMMINVSGLTLGILSLKYTAAAEPSRTLLRRTTPCEQRRWHIDIETSTRPGCSNSWKVPHAWSSSGSHIEAKMFYKSSRECCTDLFGGGECNIADFCECNENSQDGTCQLKTPQQQAPTTTNKDNCERWHFNLDTKVRIKK